MTIYLDHHSTTPVDERVIASMQPWLLQPANPHSDHALGHAAAFALRGALETIANLLGTVAEKVVITSGATESVNLAMAGFCKHPRQKRRQIVTLATEHPCALDVAATLKRDGFELDYANVDSNGRIDLDHLRQLCSDKTAMVSVAWANNEIGVVAEMDAIASIANDCGAVLHSDATQMVGRRKIDVGTSGVDLLSASSHKFYGPGGCGLLVVGGSGQRIRLTPQLIGGGQQRGLRGGTVNVASVVGMAEALRIANQLEATENRRLVELRNQFWSKLCGEIPGLSSNCINGPELESTDRLQGNLNFRLPVIEGEAWIAATPEVAFSSGSACSSVDPAPSHVLTSIGLDESAARRSVRFGFGRGNTIQDVQRATEFLVRSYKRIANL